MERARSLAEQGASGEQEQETPSAERAPAEQGEKARDPEGENRSKL